MNKPDALEAAPIIQRCCAYLLRTISQAGRLGSDARTQMGDTVANAYQLLRDGTLGPHLDACFDLSRQAGASLPEMEFVRRLISQETPSSVGGLLAKDSCIRFALATEANIIADMTFVSRQDVDQVKAAIQQPFTDAEEVAADDMVQMVYQALINLHGAVVTHLSETARPLPRMLTYQFIAPSNTLVLAYRLYSDAGRADQVRAENKIVHPGFAPPRGQALSN